MKQVIVDSEAEYELSESVTFYEEREPGLGLALLRDAREALPKIREAPERNPARNDETRRLVMKRFPFVIHYLDLPNTIWILAVRAHQPQTGILGPTAITHWAGTGKQSTLRRRKT